MRAKLRRRLSPIQRKSQPKSQTSGTCNMGGQHGQFTSSESNTTEWYLPTLLWNLAVPTVLWHPTPNCPGRMPQTRQPYGPGTAEVARKGPTGIAWVQWVAQAKSSESLRLGNFDSSSSCSR